MSRSSRGARALFGLLISAGLFGLAEVAALLFVEPQPPVLVFQLPDGSETVLEIQGDLVSLPYQHPMRIPPFPQAADPDTPRVLWLGGSSMRGIGPGSTEEGELVASRFVGEALGVESINTAAPGLDTGHIAAMLPRLLTLEPDAVVIYTGHNDLGNGVFYNRYGSGKDRWIARIRAGMGWSRLFGWVERRLRNREVFVPPTPQSQGNFQVSKARRQEIQHVYDSRLRRIVSEVKESGAVVVLATVASNPYAPSPEWECPEALADLGLGRPRPAAFPLEDLTVDALEAQLQRWPGCRDLAWLKARMDLEAGESAGREGLEVLRDEDPLPMRADRATVEVIRAVAAEEDVLLADVNQAFRDQGGGLEAAALFADFVHPNVEGQRTIAAVVAPVLAEGLGLPSPLQ